MKHVYLSMRAGFALILLLMACTVFAQQNINPVRGIVKNQKGEALQGVTITVLNQDSSVVASFVTNASGAFSINKLQPGKAYTLTFSYIGYESRLIGNYQYNGKNPALSLQLSATSETLNQVVVVGYGTQKKVNLTGAVDQVGREALENRPLPNLTRGLQGIIPNLNIRMTDGKPTRSAEYNVRGATSIGAGGSALILIDGVPGDPNMVNPNDVENITVLKDAASAAIYGARGSFGVILITTKRPAKDRTQINYSASYSLNQRTITPKMVTNGYAWTKTFDSAFYAWNDYNQHPAKSNSVFPFSLNYLDELKKRDEDPSLPKVDINPTTGEYVYYGNTDWLGELYADRDPSTEQSLSVSGSGKKADYFISGRYMYQRGIFRYSPDTYKAYNLRAKGSIQAFDWLRLENDMSYSQTSYFFPILNHPSNTPVWRRISDEAFPTTMLKNPDGTLTENASIVYGSFLSGNNYSDSNGSQIRNTSRFAASFLRNKLHVNGDLTFSNTTSIENRLYSPVPYSKVPGQMLERGENKMNEFNDRINYLGANVYADFEQRFEKHYFKALIGYNYENSKFKSLFVERDALINTSLPDFTLANGQNITLTGGGNEWTTLGTFFRLNYNFSEKYLFEVNGRYDGTSKFPQEQQFGFFPSASAGWRVSKESFWNVPRNIISDLKIRASYGSLGNGNISPYQFMQAMSVAKLNMVLNGIQPSYTQQPNVIPAGLTWEKATSANIGLDASFFNSRLSTSFDAYNRITTNMFTVGLPLPAVFGAAVPKGNYADLKTKGWELSLAWNDQTSGSKPFRYNFRFILSDNVSYITKFNNPLGLITTYYKGMRLGDIWGFENEGYFTDEGDIAKHADQSFIRVAAANKPLPGDIKFKDLNNDGVISQGKNTVDDPGDQKVVGNSLPRYQFGFNTGAEWNSFFISAFFQGVGKRDFWPGADNSWIWGPYNRPYSWQPEDVVNNMWTPENPNAYFPRLRGYVALNSRAELNVTQSKYLQNVAYIRLKNLTIGYNLPKSLVSKVKIVNAKVYFTGQNFWTYTPMYKLIKTMDPEVIEGADPDLGAGGNGNGMSYPMLKTFTIGINVTF